MIFVLSGMCSMGSVVLSCIISELLNHVFWEKVFARTLDDRKSERIIGNRHKNGTMDKCSRESSYSWVLAVAGA